MLSTRELNQYMFGEDNIGVMRTLTLLRSSEGKSRESKRDSGELHGRLD